MLPTMGSEAPGMTGAGGDGKGKRQGMFKVVVDTVREWINQLGQLAGWWRSERAGF